MLSARWWLVCYDIRDPKRLRKTAKHMEGYGERVQYSLFRCWMTHRQQQRLRWELTDMLEPEDDVLFIPLCPSCVFHIEGTFSAQRPANWPDEPPRHDVV